MKRFTIAAVAIYAVVPAQHSFAIPAPPMAAMTIEGTVQKISWHPDRFVKGLPGLSGSAGNDRTLPAHYKLTLSDTTVTSKGDGLVPFASGESIDIDLNHPKDDDFLKQTMAIRIIDFRMDGDEGGFRTRFQRIEILSDKEDEQAEDTGQKTKRQLVAKETATGAPLGGMQLLPGYARRSLQGIDSVVGEIVKDGGLTISYEIGHVSKPGEPMVGGGFRDRAKLMPKANVRWYREQTINGQPVHAAFSKDSTLLVSFPKQGMNFRTKIRSSEDFADAMLMILTYPEPADVETASAAPGDGSAPGDAPDGEPASDVDIKLDGAWKPAKLPLAGLVGGKAVEVRVRGVLRDGIMAIGGETTGTMISFGKTSWELDLRKKPALRAAAAQLNRKRVVVTGTVREVAGVEISKRTILAVNSIDPANN